MTSKSKGKSNRQEPSHRRGAAVDTAILSATIAVVARHSSTSVSVEEIAELAGVNKTTIYRRWPTPAELVAAALSAHADQNVAIPDTGSLRNDLTELAGRIRDAIGSTLGQALLAAGQADGSASQLRAAFWNDRVDAAAVILDRARKRGDALNPAVEVSHLMDFVSAPIHFRVSQRGQVVTDQVIAELVDRFMREAMLAGTARQPDLPPL